MRVIERAPLQRTENWGLNVENSFGELELKKGTHHIRFEFVDNGFSFDWFKFQDIRTRDIPVTTSQYYDEISFVYENPFTDIDEHWAEDSIVLMAHKKIINGIGNDYLTLKALLRRSRQCCLLCVQHKYLKKKL